MIVISSVCKFWHNKKVYSRFSAVHGQKQSFGHCVWQFVCMFLKGVVNVNVASGFTVAVWLLINCLTIKQFSVNVENETGPIVLSFQHSWIFILA